MKRFPAVVAAALSIFALAGVLDVGLTAAEAVPTEPAPPAPPAPAADQPPAMFRGMNTPGASHSAPPAESSTGSVGSNPAPTQRPNGGHGTTQGDDNPDGELLEFQDFPKVVTDNRLETTSNLVAIPTYVLTAQRIHDSGATSLPHLFAFVPGMDVLKLDRNNAMVGISGMFSVINDRVVGLVDGIKTADVVSGSTDFQRFPVFLDDIRQVEIVRGPGGASWGANAFFGVINILTKDPSDTQGWLASATSDPWGDVTTQACWGGESGAWSWRISAGFEHQVASSVALDKSFLANDGVDQAKVDSKLVYQSGTGPKITFGLSLLNATQDSLSVFGYNPATDSTVNMVRTYLRGEGKAGPDGTFEWTASFNAETAKLPSEWKTHELEAGLEGQYNYTGWKDQDVSIGASLRYSLADQYDIQAQDFTFAKDPNDEFWAGLFAVDRWQVGPRTWLEGQVRGDSFQFRQPGQRADWSGRASAIFALDSEQREVVRFSAAKAYRAPTLLLRADTIHRILLPTPPFPADSYAINITPGKDLKTEEIWSLESGYTGQLTPEFSLAANVYWQRYLRLLSAEETASVGPQRYYMTDNIAGAFGWGGDIEATYRTRTIELQTWYAYNGFRREEQSMILRAQPPSPNKAAAVLEWTPTPDWTGTASYRYVDQTPGDLGSAKAARAFHEMDLSLLHRFAAGHGEWMLGVQDLFNDTSLDAEDLVTVNGTHVTPGRQFVGRVQFQY
ncbi:MAG: TonB-dependent receptor plug domain-containing protein [Planctomycetota bacterium]